MYIQRGVEELASRMARCETLVRKLANGNGNPESCSGVWLWIAGAWEQLLRSDARTLGTQRMCCYEG
jgi:hypothetical protein